MIIKLLRTLILSVFTLILTSLQSHAQSIYKVKIKTLSGDMIKGEVLFVKEDSLCMMVRGKNQRLILVASDIQSLRIKRRGGTTRGFIAGASIGTLLGGVIGFASYSPPSPSCSLYCFDFGPEYDALGGALVGFAAGSICGTLVGSAGKKFEIDKGNGKLNEVMDYIKLDSSKRDKKRKKTSRTNSP